MAIETTPTTPIEVKPGSGGTTNVTSTDPGAASSFQAQQQGKLDLNTQGWWMFAGITTAILLGSTPVAPFAFGILTIALIYQTAQLLEGN